jgi:hypothetical protein
MMWLEAAAAALVGIALLMLVLGPLISPEREVDEALEPEELEETPKGVALLALREIEFDKVTGKLSDDDYDMLKRKYTAQALVALRVEEGAAAPPAVPVAVTSGMDVDAIIAARARSLAVADANGGLVCKRCGPRPESDATFCSTCGALL